ncbi:hypothetical protein D3C86_1743300 [compost metagenome]
MMSLTVRPAMRLQAPSSEGRMNFLKSWVPRGSNFMMYSAPTMANRYAFGLRLMVEKNT